MKIHTNSSSFESHSYFVSSNSLVGRDLMGFHVEVPGSSPLDGVDYPPDNVLSCAWLSVGIMVLGSLSWRTISTPTGLDNVTAVQKELSARRLELITAIGAQLL